MYFTVVLYTPMIEFGCVYKSVGFLSVNKTLYDVSLCQDIN